MPRSRRRGTSAALSPSEPCQTLEDDGVTRCSKPGTRVSGVNPPKRRCRLHHKQYIEKSKDYKEAGEIVKLFDDLYFVTLPDNAQILTYTDHRACEEQMELLQQYVEAVRKEKALREAHHKRFFLEIDEGHLNRLKFLMNKLSRIEKCLATLRTRARVLSHAAMTLDDYVRLKSTSQSHGAVAADLEAQRDISVPESYLQAPSIHHASVHTTTSSQTVTLEVWPALNAPTSASASASSSILTSTVSPASTCTNPNPPVRMSTNTSSQTVTPGTWPTSTLTASSSSSTSPSIPRTTSSIVSPASVSTTRANPHDQTPLLSHSQLDYASAVRRGGSGQRQGSAVHAATTTHFPSSAAAPSTPAPTSTSRTSQPVQSSYQYLYTYSNPQYPQYPEYNHVYNSVYNSSPSTPAPTSTPTSRTSQPVQSSYQYLYTYSNPQYPEYNHVYNSTDDSRQVRPSPTNPTPSPFPQVPDPERNCTESPPSPPPPSPPPSEDIGWIIFIGFVVFLLYKWFGT